MTRTTSLLTLALIALGTPALASDIDEVATYDLPSSVEASETDGESVQHRSRAARSNARRATPARAHAAPPRSVPARPHAAPPRAAPARPAAAYGRPAPRPVAPHAGYATRPGSAGGHPGNASRPPTVHRPAGGHRPPGVVVHPRPHGPPVVHRPGGHVRPHVVHHRPVVHTVRYSHVRPYHGIFVYGPRPVTHVTYVERGPGPVEVQRDDLPTRAIDRAHSIGIGLKGGSMISSTPTRQLYGDPGLALVGRYRPAESVGLELAIGHHGSGYVDPVGSRAQTQVAPSVQLFAFPWTRVSPYVIGGATWNSANVTDELWNGSGYEVATNTTSQWGLHGGVGLELALGNNFAFDLEGRYIGWVDERQEGEAPGAIQATAGLQVYFK